MHDVCSSLCKAQLSVNARQVLLDAIAAQLISLDSRWLGQLHGTGRTYLLQQVSGLCDESLELCFEGWLAGEAWGLLEIRRVKCPSGGDIESKYFKPR